MSDISAIDDLFITCNSDGSKGMYNVLIECKSLKQAQEAHRQVLSLKGNQDDSNLALISELKDQVKTLTGEVNDLTIDVNDLTIEVKDLGYELQDANER